MRLPGFDGRTHSALARLPSNIWPTRSYVLIKLRPRSVVLYCLVFSSNDSIPLSMSSFRYSLSCVNERYAPYIIFVFGTPLSASLRISVDISALLLYFNKAERLEFYKNKVIYYYSIFF